MKEISIVIPVYNSHECVAELSRQIADALENIAKCMNKRTIDNVVLSNDKITLEYGSKDDEK